MIQAFAFYIFAMLMIAAASFTILARNPVHSVLWLIVAFFNAAGLMVLAGAEFIAMLLVIVYVGAVAVLFLFVVMMLDVDFAELKQGFLQYLPIGALIGAVVLIELALVVGAWTFAPQKAAVAAPAISGMSNTEALGRILYTDHIYLFQAAGLVLLTAMIGAIVLTLHHRPNVKRQDMAKQAARTPEEAMEIRKVPSRQGV